MKLTKIVCTIGPASEKKDVLKKLMKEGMNVCRLNFSHGTYPSHAKLIRNIRSSAKEAGVEVAILQDLQGPRIRIGEVADEGVAVKKGETILLAPQREYKAKHTPQMLPNHYPRLAREVKKGQHILIADGTIDLKVEKIRGNQLFCAVVVGGTVKSHKGMNIPGATLTAPSITVKDKEDLVFGAAQNVDYVALSFVRNANDVKKLRALLKRHAKTHHLAKTIGIIPKIERWEAIKNFDDILAASDGIMIARGDLGIEIPAQKVPIIQKELIKKCIKAHKPVIVATQMLESMTSNRRPTRAEVSDVANAVIDHTDAIMLSGESATGAYPVETVQMMAAIAAETEGSPYDDYACGAVAKERAQKQMIAHAACDMAQTKKIKAIVVPDGDPELIALIAAHRPGVRLVGFSARAQLRRQFNLMRGVTLYPPQKQERAFLLDRGLVKKGDAILEVERDEIEIETM